MRSILAIAAGLIALLPIGATTEVVEGVTKHVPPVPAGLPNSFGYGLFNANLEDMHEGVPYHYRYQYLAGGLEDSWYNWNPNGSYVTNFINEAQSVGAIPGFQYYMIFQSAPHYDEYSNLQDEEVMAAYYEDFALLMQKADEGGGTVLINVEPDLNGVMQQHSTNTADDMALQPTSVASSGHPDVSGYPNTFRGFYQALAHIRDLYCPGCILGQDISIWGPGDDLTIALRNDPNYDWWTHADRIGQYLNSAGPGYGLLFFSPLDRDAAYYQIVWGSNRWWSVTDAVEPKFSTFASWLGHISAVTFNRVMLWQVPNGNTLYRSVNNTEGHYQDNRPQYWLNSTNGRAHAQDWAVSGVMGIMFGAGVGSQTHYFDSENDGVTNPAPINGNDLISTVEDDDGGFIRLGVGDYYDEGAFYVPGSCVGAVEFAHLTNAMGCGEGQSCYDAGVDYDYNGVVNSRDFATLQSRYGADCAP